MKVVVSILFFTILLLPACKNNKHYIPSFLKTVDSVVLVCNVADTIHTSITDKSTIKIFTGLITFQNESIENRDCNKKIRYYENGNLLLEVVYCRAGIKYERNGKKYAQRITYRAGMYFDETCY